MGDMHKFPRHSVELAQHESVVPEEQIKANKSLKKFAVVLAACAILFFGVMAVAAIAQTYKNDKSSADIAEWGRAAGRREQYLESVRQEQDQITLHDEATSTFDTPVAAAKEWWQFW